MKKIILIVVVAVVILFFVLKTQISRATKQLDYGIASGIKVNSITFGSTTVTIPIWINNPTGVNLTVSNLDLNIFVDSIYLGNAIVNSNFEIKKYSKSIVPIVLKVSNVNAMSVLLDVNSKMANSDWRSKVNITVQGKLRAESGMLYMSNIPINMDSTYKEWMG